MSTATETYQKQKAFELSAAFSIDSLKLSERKAAPLKANEVQEALKYMESGAHFGKIVVKVNA